MKQKELRTKMPEIAAWIDAMVEAFGKESVHGQIRAGLSGEPTFYARENGHEIGTPIRLRAHGELPRKAHHG